MLYTLKHAVRNENISKADIILTKFFKKLTYVYSHLKKINVMYVQLLSTKVDT